jgi:DnaD/phage-associated family protein
MKLLNGFQNNTEVTPIPNVLITEVIQHIDDIFEIKVVLYVFWLVSRRRGYPQMVTFDELAHTGITGENQPERETLAAALKNAVEHGVLLSITFERDDRIETAYCVNTLANREAIEKIRGGEIVLQDLVPVKDPGEQMTPVRDIYSLYEQNIGMITPMVAEKLKEAEESYSAEWIQEAFEEAVLNNKRNWKYIERILERWAIEGIDDGKSGRHFKKERDPNRFVRGKYGHMVER